MRPSNTDEIVCRNRIFIPTGQKVMDIGFTRVMMISVSLSSIKKISLQCRHLVPVRGTANKILTRRSLMNKNRCNCWLIAALQEK